MPVFWLGKSVRRQHVYSTLRSSFPLSLHPLFTYSKRFHAASSAFWTPRYLETRGSHTDVALPEHGLAVWQRRVKDSNMEQKDRSQQGL